MSDDSLIVYEGKCYLSPFQHSQLPSLSSPKPVQTACHNSIAAPPAVATINFQRSVLSQKYHLSYDPPVSIFVLFIIEFALPSHFMFTCSSYV